ncbi:MAG: SDR family oxidoreductase, partial [Granulosicoccaceae bacterium]
ARAIGGHFVKVDVTSEESVSNGLDAAEAWAGRPARILVNCAGIVIGSKTVGRQGPHPLDGFEKVIKINLIGTFNCTRLAAARMADAEPLACGDRGVVINTASVAAFDGQMGQAAYSASKAAIAGMTLPIARDLSSSAVRICAIAPGIFMTPMMAGMPDHVQQSLAESVPYPQRLGDPTEFAKLAAHIVDSQYMNGETIRIDGAIRLAPR